MAYNSGEQHRVASAHVHCMLYGFLTLRSWGFRSGRMPCITRLPVVHVWAFQLTVI